MDSPAPLLAIVAAALGAGCATTDLPDEASFWFEDGGVRYAIVATGTAADPANDLLRVEAGRVVLHGRDRDQDGVLDTVLTGATPLAVADAIYLRGIEIARARGAARSRELARTFEFRERGDRLVLTSVARGGSAWVNRLVRYGPTGEASPPYTDLDADGVLDGDVPATVQADYERVLAAALRAGRIERVDGRLRVGVRPR